MLLAKHGYTFGSDNIRFEGVMNFDGNRFIRETINGNSGIIYHLGYNGVIENLEFDLKVKLNAGQSLRGGIVAFNHGVIRNVRLNLLECTEENQTWDEFLMVRNNFGTIENFIINYEAPLYVYRSGSPIYVNYGTIKNGYIYGKNVQIIDGQTNYVGAAVLTRQNEENGVIENVFSLVNIDSGDGKTRGLFVLNNTGNASVKNVYSVADSNGMVNLSYGPNVYNKASKKVYNNYYFSDKIFTSELETKGNKLSLWDAEFQNQLINSDKAFVVDELVNQGYYPHLNMPDCMSSQEYIELPEVVDSDLPDILSTKVLEQGTNTVKVEFSVNNQSAETIANIQIENINVDILSQEYSNGKSKVIAELNNPTICVSNYNVLSISTKGAFGSSYTRPYEKGERVINVDLYKEVWNINDWKSINDSPTENYMLMEDLDFVNEGNTIRLENVHGIINGNDHKISNITLKDISLILNFYGTLENLYVYNFKQETLLGGGLITNANTNTLIDNVHVTNSSIMVTGSGRFGGLARNAVNCVIKNSSVTNLNINVSKEQDELYIGGIVGSVNSVSLENCYVQGLKINDARGVNSGIGGILGYAEGTNMITNCYTEGSIISKNRNVGGIAGNVIYTVNIQNCYSKVNISTTNNNSAGIAGVYLGTDANTISNNISIGSIYTTSGIDALNRIIGNNDATSSNNYAYEKQLLNGYVRVDEKGATLLNKEEILNLDLGASYNYDKKEEGILPKLYNTEGTKILPNQKDILVDEDAVSGATGFEIENIEATKPNTTEAEITVKIKNPNEVEITGIEIEDMSVTEITRNVTQSGITSITVRAIPIRYYDSYKLTGIKYKTDAIQEEQTKEAEAEISVQFYKEIYTFEDWQSIEEGTYQNYRLMADIDFSGKTNIKNNVTVNRLEAENNIYTLKNIELSYNTANTGLINNIKESIKNIGFENIKLRNTSSSGNYFGIIASNNGNIENLKFKDITIEASKLNYVGIIGSQIRGSVENVNCENVTVEGYGRVGGFIGSISVSENTFLKNIRGTILNISGRRILCWWIIRF